MTRVQLLRSEGSSKCVLWPSSIQIPLIPGVQIEWNPCHSGLLWALSDPSQRIPNSVCAHGTSCVSGLVPDTEGTMCVRTALITDLRTVKTAATQTHALSPTHFLSCLQNLFLQLWLEQSHTSAGPICIIAILLLLFKDRMRLYHCREE